MSGERPAPRVGIGVIVQRGDRILIGKRLGAHGAGHWALPGGHLEFGESVEQCAARELLEETGLVVEAFARGPYTSTVFPDQGHHYITLFMLARWVDGEAQRLEPDRCEGWHWFAWRDLPQPLFAPLHSLVASGFVP